MTKQGWNHQLLHDLKNRGPSAWLLAAVFTAFYIALYFSETLTPVALALGLGSKWTLYGLLYTVAILAGGAHVIRKYRHNPYQVVRTCVVMFTQVVFAFSIPLLLKFFNQPEFYFSYLWPLKFEYLTPSYIFSLPLPFILYSLFGSFLLVPILGVFFGKRWYCSWICGCGGLANTFGEPWRHLSSKSKASWQFEVVAIHSVLGICLVLTGLLFYTWFTGAQSPFINRYQHYYGLVVGSILSGVVGVGLYPLGGTRVWCRNFCPMAAILGLVQKAGRFRITVKKDMCISCGLCTKYCEMGIDVRAYAQANQSFTRASCVGCGLCSEVCPRGVLNLESAGARPAALVPIAPAIH
jgi:ferredoxin-type protein NapH